MWRKEVDEGRRQARASVDQLRQSNDAPMFARQIKDVVNMGSHGVCVGFLFALADFIMGNQT